LSAQAILVEIGEVKLIVQIRAIAHEYSDFANPEEYAEFILFEHGLNHFIQTLLPFDTMPASIDTSRQQLVTFTLCQVAIIQLQSAFDNPASIHKCLNAASAVFAANQRIPNIQGWEHIDSIMGVRGLIPLSRAPDQHLADFMGCNLSGTH
jgi:hypothetical protein